MSFTLTTTPSYSSLPFWIHINILLHWCFIVLVINLYFASTSSIIFTLLLHLHQQDNNNDHAATSSLKEIRTKFKKRENSKVIELPDSVLLVVPFIIERTSKLSPIDWTEDVWVKGGELNSWRSKMRGWDPLMMVVRLGALCRASSGRSCSAAAFEYEEKIWRISMVRSLNLISFIHFYVDCVC